MVAVPVLEVVTSTSAGFVGRVPNMPRSISIGVGVPGPGSSEPSVVVNVVSPWNGEYFWQL